MQSSSGSIAPPTSRSCTSRNPNDHHDTDLISFANPDDNTIGDCLTIENQSSSVPSSSQDCHEKFKQIVNEIHRYCYSKYLKTLPYLKHNHVLCIHRGAQYSMNNLYGGMASTKSQEPVNQLVPYVDMSKTKQTLDADALNKLYNMSPFTVQTTVSLINYSIYFALIFLFGVMNQILTSITASKHYVFSTLLPEPEFLNV